MCRVGLKVGCGGALPTLDYNREPGLRTATRVRYCAPFTFSFDIIAAAVGYVLVPV